MMKHGGFLVAFTVASLCELTRLITPGASDLNCSRLAKWKDNLFRKKISASCLNLVWQGSSSSEAMTGWFLVGFVVQLFLFGFAWGFLGLLCVVLPNLIVGGG